jgi:hypothetical protein
VVTDGVDSVGNTMPLEDPTGTGMPGWTAEDEADPVSCGALNDGSG